MLYPSKHDHPDRTVFYASFIMLRALKNEGAISYNDLFRFVRKEIKNGHYLFFDALHFLFLMGFISYQKQTGLLIYQVENDRIY
ncbi:ABC-three component system middle component 8 [Dichelobacter nodosus]|uniref:Uncharacterized protein n=1 Tax=Dichelobacter nodosus (strain VCS1703A) TaxID=246195 RepID=A5EUW6_DICNV|nr:conserved hypothetical protein [Dichelobacter nodosus VCS1703A]